MAGYTYKWVRDRVPPYITDEMGEDYEGGADYDGDLWIAASNYIDALEAELKKQCDHGGITAIYDTQLFEWLRNRPKSCYGNPGWNTKKD